MNPAGTSEILSLFCVKDREQGTLAPFENPLPKGAALRLTFAFKPEDRLTAFYHIRL